MSVPLLPPSIPPSSFPTPVQSPPPSPIPQNSLILPSFLPSTPLPVSPSPSVLPANPAPSSARQVLLLGYSSQALASSGDQPAQEQAALEVWKSEKSCGRPDGLQTEGKKDWRNGGEGKGERGEREFDLERFLDAAHFWSWKLYSVGDEIDEDWKEKGEMKRTFGRKRVFRVFDEAFGR